MLIGVAGKTNVGKTTFFSAATMVEAEIADRAFTTIKPNIGVSYARAKCACTKLGVKCAPVNSLCIDGNRLIPVKLIDVAGLVEGAHMGKGLGNQFLSDIMEADALIHVVDFSGASDTHGNPAGDGQGDPVRDIEFFERELDYFIAGILERSLLQLKRKLQQDKQTKLESLIYAQLSGLKISFDQIKDILKETAFTFDSDREAVLSFASEARKACKPIVIAANKCDLPAARENFRRLKGGINAPAVACSSESELALRRAAQKNVIEYLPGDADFSVIKEVDDRQGKALEFIRDVMRELGNTGVQQAINTAVFDLLGMVVVYPAANITHLSDSKGNVLPDAFLVKRGTTLKDFAGMVHTAMAERFIGGFDLKKRKLGADYILQDGDVVEILFRK